MVKYTYHNVNPSGCYEHTQFYRDSKRISNDEICDLLNNVFSEPAEGKEIIVEKDIDNGIVKTKDIIHDLIKIKKEAMEIDNEVIYLLADHIEDLIHKIRYGGFELER